MAAGLSRSSPTPPPVQAAPRATATADYVTYAQYVEEQLRKTRSQVKLVEIVSNSLALVCGALALVLVVAMIDHWVVTLNFWTRMAALAVLVGGSGWWVVTRIAPLIVRRINPVYAAYTIERAEPSLKNSLINFLLLRGDRAGERTKVHDVVYHALGQRAASDLSRVPADSVVDYTALVRIGYVLAALVVFGAAYKILSPKDPVQSVARVLAPWADIARATRVSIDDVRPGHANIFQGEQVEVSAVLRGLRASDEVRVVYSTVDGQVVEQSVPLLADTAGLRHSAKIPAAELGAQSSLQYKLVAGDAETKWHNVEVAALPHVLVTKVIYDPPAYTKLPTEEAAQGDLSGLEGTTVTLFARANREIASAYVEFDPVVDAKSAAAGDSGDARSLRITQINGQELEVRFQLRLADDRKSPWHKHYTIRYTSAEGHRNTRPIIHAISVKPDLAPLAEILSPDEREKTVPQNRMVEIEAKGIDLDFALSKLRLVAVSAGRDVLDVPLLDSPAGQAGQVLKKLEFTPSHYALEVGDVVEYWAVAEDNRTSPRSGKPEPNRTSSTPTYRLIIGPPEVERAPPPSEKPEASDLESPESADASSGGEPSGASPSSEENRDSEASKENPSESDMSSEAADSSAAGSSGSAAEEGESGEGESKESKSGESGETAGEGDASESSEGGTAGSSGSSSSDPAESQSGESGEGGNQSASESSDGSESKSSQTGGSNSSGSKPSPSGGEGASESSEPLASDGSQDGDAFEKIEQHRQQQSGGASGAQQSGSENSGQKSEGQKSEGQQSEGAQSGEQSSGDQPSGSPNASGQQQGGGQSQDQKQKNGDQQGSQAGQPSGGEQSGSKPQQGSSGSKPENQGGQNDQGQNQNASGSQAGGQPQGGAKPEGQKPASGGGEQPKDSGGGQGQNDKSGAAKESQGGGSPQQQAENPQQKNGQQSSGGQQSGGQKQEDSGKSPSGSNQSSNSQGDSGGDRKGGGEQGGGQGAQKPGNDSAGSSSAGEQGDGAANEPGAGQSGNRGGGDQIANSPTGRSGEEAGEGSSSGSAKQGEQPQSQSGNSPGGDSSRSGDQPGGNQPREGEASDGTGEQISDTPGAGRGTLPIGGGEPADNHPSGTPLPDIEPGADAANLEYARKATDLTLEYLKHQKDHPDRELLDKLGWTKDDLAKFIERWDQMQRAAARDETGSAKRKLDDSLRSLGLRPRTSAVRSDDTGGTRLTNQRDSAARSRPPKSYAEQYRAFSKLITPAK